MKRIIGRKEKITIKEWGLTAVPAKVDTGAYTSAIHSEYAEEILVDGKKRLVFTILPPGHPSYKDRTISTENYSIKKVKNSFGQTEKRFKVNTKITMFGEEFDASFTLSDRSEMKNPILLGRKILKGRFLVDVDLINQSQKKNPSSK